MVFRHGMPGAFLPLRTMSKVFTRYLDYVELVLSIKTQRIKITKRPVEPLTHNFARVEAHLCSGTQHLP